MRHLYLVFFIIFLLYNYSISNGEILLENTDNSNSLFSSFTSKLPTTILSSSLSSSSTTLVKKDEIKKKNPSSVRMIAKKINNLLFDNFNKKIFKKKNNRNLLTKSFSNENTSTESMASSEISSDSYEFSETSITSESSVSNSSSRLSRHNFYNSFGNNEDEDDDEEEGLQKTIVLLFMFFGLSLGILVMQGLSYVGEVIPYTVIIFILGMVFALCDDRNGKFFNLFILLLYFKIILLFL